MGYHKRSITSWEDKSIDPSEDLSNILTIRSWITLVHLLVILLVSTYDDGNHPGASRHNPLDVACGQVGGVASSPGWKLGSQDGVKLLGQDTCGLGSQIENSVTRGITNDRSVI